MNLVWLGEEVFICMKSLHLFWRMNMCISWGGFTSNSISQAIDMWGFVCFWELNGFPKGCLWLDDYVSRASPSNLATSQWLTVALLELVSDFQCWIECRYIKILKSGLTVCGAFCQLEAGRRILCFACHTPCMWTPRWYNNPLA